MICGLAEEGARAIGANVDLIRTDRFITTLASCMLRDWFIENGTNPTPTMPSTIRKASAAVLQAHVDEGLKLAKRHRLPADRRFHPRTPRHLEDGVLPAHRAQERDAEVDENLFRHHGPSAFP